nr:hypothetical protein HmN_000440500 [Hymenolepis microstoma]
MAIQYELDILIDALRSPSQFYPPSPSSRLMDILYCSSQQFASHGYKLSFSSTVNNNICYMTYRMFAHFEWIKLNVKISVPKINAVVSISLDVGSPTEVNFPPIPVVQNCTLRPESSS